MSGTELSAVAKLDESIDEIVALVKVAGMATKAYDIDDGIFFDGPALYRLLEHIEKRLTEVSWMSDALRQKEVPEPSPR